MPPWTLFLNMLSTKPFPYILPSVHEKLSSRGMSIWNSVVYWYVPLWISDFKFLYPLLLDLSCKSEFFKLRINIALVTNFDNSSVLLFLVVVLLYVPPLRLAAYIVLKRYHKVNDYIRKRRAKLLYDICTGTMFQCYQYLCFT